ncbi:MAG: dihydrolipoamide acetyltransferase family protein [Anaerolineae bacterium]
MPILDIVIPDEIGDVEECIIVTWLKKEGDAINKDDTLFIIQAEKVSFDVLAPASGRVAAILAQQGEVVKRGQVVAQIEADTEIQPSAPPEPVIAPATPSPPAREVRASPVAKRLAREHDIDLSRVSGSGSGGRITEKDVLAFIEAQRAKEATPPTPAREVRASPVAKRLAREHDIDLSQVPAGSGSRLTEKDVLAFIEARAPTQPSKEEQATQALPLAGMRATIARRMHQSLQEMAQLTLHTEADATELVALYERLKQQLPLTYTDLIVRACALALRRHPHLNATLANGAIRLLPQINIGVAVALDGGLVVPVINEADRQSLPGLVQTRRQLVERARAQQLTAEDMNGGTFTVTNLGRYEIDGFTPIINPPEAAILGIGRIMEKVVVHRGKIAQRAMMTLSLTFDHRLVDGAPAAAFLQSIKQLLEEPAQLER